MSFCEPFTEFKSKKKIRLTGGILAEYIYIEEEERNKLVKNKLEYLIEQVQYNGELVLNKDKLDCDNLFSERLFFENPCKEIVWAMQRTDFISGSRPNKERKYYNYGFIFETGMINPGKKARIDFSSRVREEFKDIVYYNIIQPYKHHQNTPDIGINVYSFSLKPEIQQPSGSANLSKLDDIVLNVKMKNSIVEQIKSENIRLRWPIYITSYNILRIFSGLAGLTFFK